MQELPVGLDVDPVARADRLERQIHGLQEQLQHRIRQVAHLQNELAAARNAAPVDPEILARAEAYDRLGRQPAVRFAVRARRLVRRAGNVLSDRVNR